LLKCAALFSLVRLVRNDTLSNSASYGDRVGLIAHHEVQGLFRHREMLMILRAHTTFFGKIVFEPSLLEGIAAPVMSPCDRPQQRDAGGVSLSSRFSVFYESCPLSPFLHFCTHADITASLPQPPLGFCLFRIFYWVCFFSTRRHSFTYESRFSNFPLDVRWSPIFSWTTRF